MNHLLVGSGFTAVFGCAIAAVHCFVNALLVIRGHEFTLFENLTWSAVYIASWVLGICMSVNDGSFTPLEFITLITLLFYFGTVFFKSERVIRYCTLGNSVGYLVYNLAHMNIAAVSQLLSIISTVVALIRFREKKVPPLVNKTK